MISGVCKPYPAHIRIITVSRRLPVYSEALLVCPSYKGSPALPDGYHCNIAAVPGNTSVPCCHFGHGIVVSYGMSVQDTVTFSSIDGKTAVLAVRRETETVSGRIIDRQEFPVCIPPRLEPSDALACFASLLILDIPLTSDSIS